MKKIGKNTYKPGFLTLLVVVVLTSIMLRIFAFEVYFIPSHSMDSTLLSGDVILVSKLNYGSRIFTDENKSKRLLYLSKIKLKDVLVFNFPEGESVFSKRPEINYYSSVGFNGRNKTLQDTVEFGAIVNVPIKYRQPYIKRCLALPGQDFILHKGNIYYKENAAYDSILISRDKRFNFSLANNYCWIFPHIYKWNKNNIGPLQIPSKGSGLIGFVLFIAFLGYIVYELLLQTKISSKTSKMTLPVFVAILTGSFLSYPLFSLPSYILLVLFLALAANQQQAFYIFKLNRIKGIILLLLTVAILFTFYKKEAAKYQAYKDLKLATYFMASQSYAVAIQEFEDLYPVLKYNGSFLQHYGKALSLDNQPVVSNKILQEASLFNNDIFLCTTMGDIYKALKDYFKAETAYQEAMDMAPHKFFAPYLLARLHHENGNEEKAANLAEELIKKEVKVPSMAIEEIKQEMKDILNARYPNIKAPEGEKSDAKRKGPGSKEDV